MKFRLHEETSGRRMRMVFAMCGLMPGLMSGASTVMAQTAPAGASRDANVTTETLHLAHTNQQNDANEVVTAIRNMVDPRTKIYLVPSQYAIVVSGSADQVAQARKLLNELDGPKKTFRLIYTLTETDADKVVGVQHFAMVIVSGSRTVLKQGSKVPVVTGEYKMDVAATQKQVTYLDIGLNFGATLDEAAEGLRLQSKVERLSVAEERSGVGVEDPVIRQTQIEGAVNLVPGRPVALGSMDVPGSTRQLKVEVVAEVVR